jgi:TonB-dependent starch-binding outer membrane protein SusC
VHVPQEHQGQGIQRGFIGQGKNNIRNLNNQGFLVWENYLNDGGLILTSQVGYSFLNFERSLTYNQATQLLPGPVNVGQANAFLLISPISQKKNLG